MGIGLKDIMKEDKNSLVEDKQKKTIKSLIFVGIALAVIILVVIALIVVSSINAKREERIHLISKDVVNISNVVKKIGEQYISNTYNGLLAGVSLDNNPIEIIVNGKVVQYKYGYYYLTPADVATLITSLNIPNETYLVNYINGDVVNLTGVKTKDGKVYHSLEDITSIESGLPVKNVIYIHSADEMLLLHQYPTANFRLSENIDMTSLSDGEGWKPVESFHGTFDGRGYTISGLNLARPTTMYCGLFGQITSSASVKDVNFENVAIRGGEYTGTLAGFSSGNITNVRITNGSVNSQAESVGGLVGAYDKGLITDCTVDNISINANGSVGGLIGTLYSGTIQRTGVSAQIVGMNTVGGLIGEVKANAGTYIKETYAKANMTGKVNAGGLIGDVQIISPSTFKLNDCYAEGSISGGEQNIGGAIGNIYTANNAEIEFKDVYTATDTSADATIRGGFIGTTNIGAGSSSVYRCCFEKDPLLDLNLQDVGNKSQGAIITIDSKTPAEMKNRVTYADWDFDIWVLEEGIARPHLKWEDENYEPQIIEEK